MEVKTIKDTNLKLSKILTSKKDGSNQSGKKGKSKDKKDKKSKSKKPKIADKYKWKTVPLKDSDLTKEVKGNMYLFKTINNKDYYWCKYHATWVMHKPEGDGKEGCRLHKNQDGGDTTRTKCNNYSFVNALMSILEEIEEDDNDQL